MTSLLSRGAEPGVPVLPSDGKPVRTAAATVAEAPLDIVEQWGVQSFPASDPPANW